MHEQLSSAPATAAPENRNGIAHAAARIRMLDTVAGYVGQDELADALGLGSARALRMKLSADRGVTDQDLRRAADRAVARAAEILDHAARIRAHLGCEYNLRDHVAELHAAERRQVPA